MPGLCNFKLHFCHISTAGEGCFLLPGEHLKPFRLSLFLRSHGQGGRPFFQPVPCRKQRIHAVLIFCIRQLFGTLVIATIAGAGHALVLIIRDHPVFEHHKSASVLHILEPLRQGRKLRIVAEANRNVHPMSDLQAILIHVPFAAPDRFISTLVQVADSRRDVCVDFHMADRVDVSVIRLNPQILFNILRSHQLRQKTARTTFYRRGECLFSVKIIKGIHERDLRLAGFLPSADVQILIGMDCEVVKGAHNILAFFLDVNNEKRPAGLFALQVLNVYEQVYAT